MNGSASRPCAIVVSGWDWTAHNVPERVATALAGAGWRILYCENPASFFRKRERGRYLLPEGIAVHQPRFLGHRLNAWPRGSKWQAKLLVGQILRRARAMGLTRPIFIYPHGHWVVDLARELKHRGTVGVFVCMDQIEQAQLEALTEASRLTLVIPRTTYSRLRAKFGDKVRLIPQLGPEAGGSAPNATEHRELTRLERIPHPRLVYLGLPTDRLNVRLLRELLPAHPDWHFVACGHVPGLSLPNIHDMGRFEPGDRPGICRAVDVGFMPYDCGDERNLHCVPLKLFDYFAAGLPVVSTPLIHLREYGDLVYLGDTTEQLAAGVRHALAESADDPRREERRNIARAHSLDKMSKLLSELLMENVLAGTGRTARG